MKYAFIIIINIFGVHAPDDITHGMRVGQLFERESDCLALAHDVADLMTQLVAPAAPQHPISAHYFCHRVSEIPDSQGRYVVMASDGTVVGYLGQGSRTYIPADG